MSYPQEHSFAVDKIAHKQKRRDAETITASTPCMKAVRFNGRAGERGGESARRLNVFG